MGARQISWDNRRCEPAAALLALLWRRTQQRAAHPEFRSEKPVPLSTPLEAIAPRHRIRPAAGEASTETEPDPLPKPRRVAIFNVKYSPNLGDGIIAECLEDELSRAGCGIVPVPIDLAGRSGFNQDLQGHRHHLLRFLESLPDSLRANLVPALLSAIVRTRVAPNYDRGLEGCEAAIIGGGALFADADQNFPIKLGAALMLCRRRALPVAVASVGVSEHWSKAGLRRLRRSLAANRLISVSARDEHSVERCNVLFANVTGTRASLAHDPGLLCADRYGAVGRRAGGARPLVGLCVTSPLVLRLHGEQQRCGDEAAADWTVALVRDLVRRGFDVVLFTNGSPEDRTWRDRLAIACNAMDRLQLAPDFHSPGELARFIGGLDAVVAHRLHACIAAYSYRVPAVGLAWDRKLASFLELSDRARFLVRPASVSPPQAAAMVAAALAEPIDVSKHAELRTRSRRAIVQLAHEIVAQVPAQ